MALGYYRHNKFNSRKPLGADTTSNYKEVNGTEAPVEFDFLGFVHRRLLHRYCPLTSDEFFSNSRLPFCELTSTTKNVVASRHWAPRHSAE